MVHPASNIDIDDMVIEASPGTPALPNVPDPIIKSCVVPRFNRPSLLPSYQILTAVTSESIDVPVLVTIMLLKYASDLSVFAVKEITA